MKQVTFLHCADLHLDSPMIGLKHLPEAIFNRVKESTFQALTNITEAAISRKVDFVIFAGDLFDGEDRSLRAQAYLRREMEKLGKQGIPVYLVHGNHDHLDGSWLHMELPENVFTFGETVEMKPFTKVDGTQVHLYGFSYPKRHVYERMVQSYKKLPGADFHIGILHGHHEDSSEHGKYAPFQLTELMEKQFDYWALGHIHKRMVLAEDPPVVYPGNTQGRNKKETGEKGCYHVTLSETEVYSEFIETADVIWKQIEVDGSGITGFDDLFHSCREAMAEHRIEGKGVLMSLTLSNTEEMPDELLDKVINGELVEILQEEEKDEDSFVWAAEIAALDGTHWERDRLAENASFFDELFTTIDGYDEIESALSPLYQHNVFRRFIPLLEHKEKADLLNEAEHLLVKLLYQAQDDKQ